jgi:hypothetical protein
MSWLTRKLFSREEKVPGKKQIEESLPSEDIPSPLAKELWVCQACTGSIDCGERWSKFNGKYFHKVCLKNLKKGVYNGS